ncbi:CHAT domain-containing protein [uncultured Nostoc sp.]|uniref:CHAT domain-containing protein n=1 Tax=uncultured Nostoc sp. TaxID=340711 RepID=UPI0025DA9B29|nr:CHAT domain-containing protein [Nostoc sp. NMS1]
MASLWSLDDESSQTFIGKFFYKAITQPQTSRAEALRQARLALLQAQDGLYIHPRYWAPFLLVGTGSSSCLAPSKMTYGGRKCSKNNSISMVSMVRLVSISFHH